MKAISVGVVIAVVASVAMAGCATMSDVLDSKEEGTVEVYPVDQNRAWEIAMTVLRWEDAETIEEHRADDYMLTTVGANLISAGSVVGVWVEPAKKGSTKVTVVTKRKMQTNIATGLTETTFHDRFAQAVKIVKSGKSLPRKAPN
jgi:hypothetical protein